ncbi:MAG: rhodanese-like domain-containing protein [Chloroflexota bacterium]
MTASTHSIAINPAEVDSLTRSGAELKLIDVRTPSEFETAHIPGSYNVPLNVLPEHRAEFQGLGGAVVLVCQSGVRARQAEQILREQDLERLQVLTGGIQAWESAGLQLNRGQQRWSLERQVRAIAGSLVLLGTLGSLFIWPPMIFLAMFVGGGLLFAGVSDICMMGLLLTRLPYNQAGRSNVGHVLAQLSGKTAGSSTPV